MLKSLARTVILMMVVTLISACGPSESAVLPTATIVPAPTRAATHAPTASSTSTSAPPTPEAPVQLEEDATVLTTISASTVDQMERLQTLNGHGDKVFALAFSADLDHLASSSRDMTIKLWDLESAQEVHSYSTSELEMNSIAFSPDGSLLACADAIWDVESRQVVHSFERVRTVPSPVAFSPDGSLLAIAPLDQVIELWNLTSGEVVRTFDRQDDNIAFSIAFSPDSQVLAAGGREGRVRLWDVEMGQVADNLEYGNESDIHDVAFSPDGSVLASGGTDNTVRLWDVESGQVAHTLRHRNGLYGVAFSPDGTILASAGVDGSVKLWDAKSGEMLRSLQHDDELMAVAFSPDGSVLAAGGYDHTIALWGVAAAVLPSPPPQADPSPESVLEPEQPDIKIWSLGGNGWALSLGGRLLIFDYVESTDPNPPAAGEARDLQRGYIDTEEIEDYEVTVFVTHSHPDHYDPVIFEWEKDIDDIRYVFGWQVGGNPEHHHLVGPRAYAQVGEMDVSTINSHHAGVPEVAYLVRIDGVTIYHNGDYMAGYEEDFAYLKTIADHVDVAFVIGWPYPNHQQFQQALLFAELFSPDYLFANCREGDEEKCGQFADLLAERGVDGTIRHSERRGEAFDLVLGMGN